MFEARGRRCLAALAALAAAALCACGSSAQGGGGGGAGGGGGGSSGSCAGGSICFTMQVLVTGSVQVSGTVKIAGDASSCSAWAQGKPGNDFFVPRPDYGVSLDGQDFRININTGGFTYHGPGTYPTEFGGSFTAGGVNFVGPHSTGATGQALIKGDGSGSFTFSNVPATLGSDRASGVFTWTCS